MLTRMTILTLFGLDAGALFLVRFAETGGWAISVLFVAIFHMLTAAAIMWFLIWFFPVTEGEFEEGSREFDRWQARAFLSLLSCHLIDQAVPIFLKAQWYMLFGAKLRWNTHIAGRLLDCSLVEMDSKALLGTDGLIMGHFQVGSRVRVGRVRVGRNATVGARAVVLPGTVIGEQAVVGALALVSSGQHVPAGETWVGIPARRLESPRSHESKLNAEAIALPVDVAGAGCTSARGC